MKKSALIFLFIALPLWLAAQQSSSGDFQDGILLEQIGSVNERSLFLQGNNQPNVSILGYQEIMEQLRSRMANSSYENMIHLNQEGRGHTSSVRQTGKGNAMELTQRGTNNKYEGFVSGEDNLIHLLQDGDYNSLYQDIIGTGAELQLIQEGSRLEMIQIETSGNAPRYQVHQRGEGMRIKIEHSQLFPLP